MTQKDKDLLLKDLCARLLYGVKILHETWNYEWDQELSVLERVVGIDETFIYVKVIDEHTGEEYRDDSHTIDLFNDKPFLRPMSSMTEEEREEWADLFMKPICELEQYVDEKEAQDTAPVLFGKSHSISIDWLNAHHFDYRNLIEKGLALEAPKGMYNIE